MLLALSGTLVTGAPGGRHVLRQLVLLWLTGLRLITLGHVRRGDRTIVGMVTPSAA